MPRTARAICPLLLCAALLCCGASAVAQQSIAFQSPQYSPFGTGYSRTFSIVAAPRAVGSVTLTFTARADLSSQTELIDIYLNGVRAGVAFGPTGSDCPAAPNVESLAISEAAYNAAADSGAVQIEMRPSSAVNAGQCNPPSYISVRVSYVVARDCNDNGVPDVFEPDCNFNGVPDDCDVAEGTSLDCNGDGLPDECGNDCNANGRDDGCDIDMGFSADCDDDGVPDECEPDCDGNGFPDACDIAAGRALDCNHNGVPDACDIAQGGVADCNDNGVPDICEIAGRPDLDCDENGVLDACDPDCNHNGYPDACDIRDLNSSDCDGDGIPDECEADCDGSGQPDSCDIAQGAAEDCNGNGVPDACDIASGRSRDDNRSGIPDECESRPVLFGSPRLSPIGAGTVQSWRIFNPPEAVSDVTVSVRARADLSSTTERLFLELNNVPIGTLFESGGHDCPTTPDLATLTVPAAVFNAAVGSGDAFVEVIPSGAVSGSQCIPPSYATIELRYDGTGGRIGPLIIPWLEVNSASAAEINVAVAGLQQWQNITDTALISTNPDRAWLYTTLRQRVPGMQIIPGLKTDYFLDPGRFTDLLGWQRMAVAVADVVATSGQSRVLLENESTLYGYWSGQWTINFTELRSRLALLPPNVEIIWYPAYTGRTAQERTRSAALCNAVEAALNARFVDSSRGHPLFVNDPDWIYNRGQLDAISVEPLLPIFYFGTFGGWMYWPYDRVLEIRGLAPEDQALFYPGYARWFESGQIISSILLGGGGGQIEVNPKDKALGE